MNQESQKETVFINFIQASYYRKVPATGVYGGPTPNGEVLCNFFVESRALPTRIETEIGPEGKGPDMQHFQEGKIEIQRELQVGVLLNPRTAKSVGKWLIKHANDVLGIEDKLQ